MADRRARASAGGLKLSVLQPKSLGAPDRFLAQVVHPYDDGARRLYFASFARGGAACAFALSGGIFEARSICGRAMRPAKSSSL